MGWGPEGDVTRKSAYFLDGIRQNCMYFVEFGNKNTGGHSSFPSSLWFEKLCYVDLKLDQKLSVLLRVSKGYDLKVKIAFELV